MDELEYQPKDTEQICGNKHVYLKIIFNMPSVSHRIFKNSREYTVYTVKY